MTAEDIRGLLLAIERIPSWRMWWLEKQPSTAERIVKALRLLRADIQKEGIRHG